MSERSFWIIFGKVADKFVVKKRDGWIRHGRVCPVCAVANYKLGGKRYSLLARTSAREIGLDDTFAESVIIAADFPSNVSLRPKLLKIIKDARNAKKKN